MAQIQYPSVLQGFETIIDSRLLHRKSAVFAALFIFRIAFHVASTKYPERSSGKAISFDCNIPKSAEKVDKTQYNSRVG